MTTQPENKDNTETKIAKDELSEEQLAKATGGSITRKIDVASPIFFQVAATPVKTP
jgi:hypothetical protein